MAEKRVNTENIPGPPAKTSKVVLTRLSDVCIGMFKIMDVEDQKLVLKMCLDHSDLDVLKPTKTYINVRIKEESSKKDIIKELPKEISLLILSKLEPEDLVKAAQVTKLWRTLSDDNLIWRDKCLKENITKLRRNTRTLPATTSTWKSTYLWWKKHQKGK